MSATIRDLAKIGAASAAAARPRQMEPEALPPLAASPADTLPLGCTGIDAAGVHVVIVGGDNHYPCASHTMALVTLETFRRTGVCR